MVSYDYFAKTSDESYGPFRLVRFDGTFLLYHLIKQCDRDEIESASQKKVRLLFWTNQEAIIEIFSVRCFC